MSEIRIIEISAKETYAVRWPVLRQGKPVESCHFDGDDLTSTVHFGLYDDSGLAAVASVFTARHQYFQQEKQAQLRGMAVLDKHRQKGYGLALLEHAERYVSGHADIMWFNAREVAVGFYTKSGYQTKGELFIISDVGVHYVMYKYL
jgi:GNAT superfamily N-acetyltransferase